MMRCKHCMLFRRHVIELNSMMLCLRIVRPFPTGGAVLFSYGGSFSNSAWPASLDLVFAFIFVVSSSLELFDGIAIQPLHPPILDVGSSEDQFYT